MVKSRARKTNRGKVSKEVMLLAAKEVLENNRKNRAVAREFEICHVTLARFCQKMKAGNPSPEVGYRAHNKVLDSEQELQLSGYLKKCDNLFFGLFPQEVRKLAYQYAISNNKRVPEGWNEYKMASVDWFTAFLKRNPWLSLRTLETTNLQRVTNFNKVNVDQFYDNLMSVYKRHNFEAHRIFNADETVITILQKPNKTVPSKGQKEIGAITSQERDTFMTVCLAVSASGNSIPPMFLFPQAKCHDHFLHNAPPGSVGWANESGWMQDEDFFEFIKHFAKHVKPSTDDNVLLLLDTHASHLYIPTIDFCKENGIVLLSFPPHTSHRLQPLDRGVYGPFKKYVRSAMDGWLANNPGERMTIHDLPGIVKEALPLATTPKNICSSFACTGIFPYNRNIFTNDDCSRAEITDKPETLVKNEETALPNIAEETNSSRELNISHTASISAEVNIGEIIQPYPKANSNTNKSRENLSKRKTAHYGDL